MENAQNPYQSSLAAQRAPATPDERLLRHVLERLDRARTRPPTLANILLHWRLLVLVVLGSVAIGLLVVAELSNEWILLFVGLLVGAVLRDFGYARMAMRYWPVQKDLFDWPKIDALIEERNLPKHSAR